MSLEWLEKKKGTFCWTHGRNNVAEIFLIREVVPHSVNKVNFANIKDNNFEFLYKQKFPLLMIKIPMTLQQPLMNILMDIFIS